MEYHHFADASGLNLRVASDDRMQMQVTDRTTGKASKLQVHPARVFVWNDYLGAVDVSQLSEREGIARL